MSEPRVIKKYPNRRLYDTVESRYITLADVRRLVVERIEFVVVDKKNNADITRSILLQVIAEQENLAEPILSQEFMVNVIRAYGTSSHGPVSALLDQSLKHHESAARDSAAANAFAGGRFVQGTVRDAIRREGPRRARRRQVIDATMEGAGIPRPLGCGQESCGRHQMTQRSRLTIGLPAGIAKAA